MLHLHWSVPRIRQLRIILRMLSTSIPVEETNASEACISGINQHVINDVQCDDAAKPLQPQMESSSDTFASPMLCGVGEIDNVLIPHQIETLVKLGHTSPPNPLPPDCTGYVIP